MYAYICACELHRLTIDITTVSTPMEMTRFWEIISFVISVDADDKHIVALVKRILRSVAVVHINVKNHNPRRPQSVQCVFCAYADVIKEAEAMGFVWACVVACIHACTYTHI